MLRRKRLSQQTPARIGQPIDQDHMTALSLVKIALMIALARAACQTVWEYSLAPSLRLCYAATIPASHHL